MSSYPHHTFGWKITNILRSYPSLDPQWRCFLHATNICESNGEDTRHAPLPFATTSFGAFLKCTWSTLVQIRSVLEVHLCKFEVYLKYTCANLKCTWSSLCKFDFCNWGKDMNVSVFKYPLLLGWHKILHLEMFLSGVSKSHLWRI